MKKTLLAVGIAIFAAGTICLAFAALNLFVFGRALDGSAALYARLHQRAVVSFVIGAVLAAIGGGVRHHFRKTKAGALTPKGRR